jgi:hypothetical protein
MAQLKEGTTQHLEEQRSITANEMDRDHWGGGLREDLQLARQVSNQEPREEWALPPWGRKLVHSRRGPREEAGPRLQKTLFPVSREGKPGGRGVKQPEITTTRQQAAC